MKLYKLDFYDLELSYDDYKESFIIGINLNETDIIESDCFTDKKSAECELENMKQKYSRCEWTLNKYAIDECEWTDGFVRV